MDPYNDNDPVYASTPLVSPTAIPTFHNTPRLRFQPAGGHSNHQQQRQGFQFGAHQQGPLRYDPHHGLQPQGYPGPPHGHHGYSHHPLNHYQQNAPHHNQQPLMRPLRPPAEFLDQHLDVFQAASYDLPEGCFKIESGPPEPVDMNLFCVQDIVDKLVESKKRLRAVPQELFGRARQRCNPYELVGSSIFMNRASVKLASIDSQLALTATKEDPGSPISDQVSGAGVDDPVIIAKDTFRFADLCSGPGGFSEYLLWRKHTWGERARGWAMTLRGELDFQLDRFHKDAAVQETLKVFYGQDATGNILKQENIDAFVEMLERETAGLGVGLVSADGGVSVDGDEAVQETLLQRLILCQILTMFMVLQKGGDFVVKIFDIFTPVTAGLVWILSRHFEKICVMKPLTSRPMNSERYVVCRHLLERRPAKVIEHLKQVNARYQDIDDRAASEKSDTKDTPDTMKPAGDTTIKKEDVNHIVDLKVLTEDSHFMEYIKRNNMKTAIRQTEALDVFLKYVNEGLRPAFDQEAIKRLCLQEWRIPPRPQPHHPQQHQQQRQHGGPPQPRYPSQHPPYHHSNPSARHHPYQQQQQQYHQSSRAQQQPSSGNMGNNRGQQHYNHAHQQPPPPRR